MRRKEDRTNRILELLVKEKKLEVAEISGHLGVSQVTVRKDLDAMEAQGLITREHGFAVLSSTDDIKGRLAWHYEEKRKIACLAADLVKDGDTIMIESGSCCALLAKALTEIRKGVTIITNSAFIADYIRRESDFQIVLLGGIYQQDAQVMVGPMVRQCAENSRDIFIPFSELGKVQKITSDKGLSLDGVTIIYGRHYLQMSAIYNGGAP